jgi:outer membrane biosynthesis protein TonB
VAQPPAADTEPAEVIPPPSEVPAAADTPPTSVASSGAATPSPTPVPQEQATVQGSYDKDIIRRIVRAHIGEVRFCYEKELQANPALKGRAALRFSIGAEGTVVATERVEVEPDDDAMRAVADCAAHAMRRWTFPKPDGGGSVVVTYPFVFEPG